MRRQVREFIESGDMEYVGYYGGNNESSRTHGYVLDENRMYKQVMTKQDLSQENSVFTTSDPTTGYYRLTVKVYTYDGDWDAIEIYSRSVDYCLDHKIKPFQKPCEENDWVNNITFSDVIAEEMWDNFLETTNTQDTKRICDEYVNAKAKKRAQEYLDNFNNNLKEKADLREKLAEANKKLAEIKRKENERVGLSLETQLKQATSLAINPNKVTNGKMNLSEALDKYEEVPQLIRENV